MTSVAERRCDHSVTQLRVQRLSCCLITFVSQAAAKQTMADLNKSALVGHSGYFPFLFHTWQLNVRRHTRSPFQIVSLGCIPRSGITGSRGLSMVKALDTGCQTPFGRGDINLCPPSPPPPCTLPSFSPPSRDLRFMILLSARCLDEWTNLLF